MNTSWSIVFALLAGAAAGTVSSRFSSGSDTAPVADLASDLSLRLTTVEARVAALVASTAVVIPEVTVGSVAIEPKREPVALVDDDARRRLDLLEQAFARLRGSAESAAQPDRAQAVSAAARVPKKTVAEQQRALLTAATDAEKLAVWSNLRSEENCYDDAVVATMVQIGLTSKDPEVRADVWRQADGRSKHAALVPALVQALQVDVDAKVREEAAETLEGYLDAPGVQQALAAAKESDADEKVRRQASRTLEQRKR